jgi:hypothetical protein
VAWTLGDDNTRRKAMARITPVEEPGLAGRVAYTIGKRLFGQVPTPQRLMAHRMPLMLGIGGLYGAIEWFGIVDAQLRALLQARVAQLAHARY